MDHEITGSGSHEEDDDSMIVPDHDSSKHAGSLSSPGATHHGSNAQCPSRDHYPIQGPCQEWSAASLANAGEVNRHAVGLARVEQQYYIYSSTFDPGEYQDDAAPRIKTQHGCSNVVNLLDVIRSSKAVSVPAVKSVQGKAAKLKPRQGARHGNPVSPTNLN